MLYALPAVSITLHDTLNKQPDSLLLATPNEAQCARSC